MTTRQGILLPVALVALLATAPGAIPAAAQSGESDTLRLVITQGQIEPIRIAVADFTAPDAAARVEGERVRDVALADLVNSHLFAAVPRAAFIEEIRDPGVRPRFMDWRLINTQWLVTGEALFDGGGRLVIRFRLWDVFGGRQATGLQLAGPASSWRRIAHRLADTVYTEITGEGPYFDSRIAFVEESGPKNDRAKRLAIMDQDGANIQYLRPTGELSMTPKFSPSRQDLLYISFLRGESQVYMYEIETGQTEFLGDFEGMTFAPRFAPDGRTVVMSFAQDGNSDIYLMDLETRERQRLTTNPSVDTAPTFSPDGKRIAFESDRGAGQEIYVMNVDGSDPERITFGQGSYATPAWSPRGDLIAFTKQYEGNFHIGLMRPDGSGEKILTEGYHNEGPTWAPNGRVLMFFREFRDPGALPKLYTIDVSGHFLREIATPRGASDPSWSSLLELN